MILHYQCNAFSKLFRNALACLFKTDSDVVNPILGCNFFEKHNITEFVKWHAAAFKNFREHVSLASVDAIGGSMMMLPVRPQLFLKSQSMIEETDVLKFIYANYEMKFFAA